MDQESDENECYQYILHHDSEIMPPPPMDFENEANVLLNKVRKHYYEYVICLLKRNYECVHKLPKDSVRLPSAIYKCAKQVESRAAQASMLLQLYRQNIIKLVKQLKIDTEKHRLNKMLLEYLTSPHRNDKGVQANLEQKNRKRRRECDVEVGQTVSEEVQCPLQSPHSSSLQTVPMDTSTQAQHSPPNDSTLYSVPDTTAGRVLPSIRDSVDSDSLQLDVCMKDDIFKELEEMFKDDHNSIEEDLFNGTLCDSLGVSSSTQDQPPYEGAPEAGTAPGECAIAEVTREQIKSLDERLALLESSGVLRNETLVSQELGPAAAPPPPARRERPPTRSTQSKWLCEVYHQRLSLSQKLYEVREESYRKHLAIKSKYLDLFGEDSEDEEMVSPAEDNAEFVLSCKERIAPWIVQNLMPYFKKGRIMNKHLFKAVAKHSLSIIIEGNRYPDEYEVHLFIKRFFQRHSKIRCEADFKYSVY